MSRLLLHVNVSDVLVGYGKNLPIPWLSADLSSTPFLLLSIFGVLSVTVGQKRGNLFAVGYESYLSWESWMGVSGPPEFRRFFDLRFKRSVRKAMLVQFGVHTVFASYSCPWLSLLQNHSPNLRHHTLDYERESSSAEIHHGESRGLTDSLQSLPAPP